MLRTLSVLALLSTASAADLQFRPHAIDPEHLNSAACAIDVDRDGKLDVVSGGWWYRAPDWKRTFVRDVEVIRGRFDDYSNLPLDVNGDGRTDYISANYRSSKLYWIEQPADPTAAWITHTVGQPGRMETARLVDLNGDGRLDLVPNGTDFAAWWEISPKTDASDEVTWTRHELPEELKGHGVGWGDLNGDGRLDLVCPKGWAEAPVDRVAGEWKWHAEFRLHRDGSVPMLVFDVDSDGDADLVWGRAHHTGLYWLEQGRDGDRRTWAPHVIDTAWSQPHTLELADLDGDGRPEVVAGKRYLAHDGKDVGEWDPLIICAYSFLPDSKTWRRQVLVSGTDVGWDLDPEIVDLDADGDLDFVCPGRSGLYWLENVTGSAPRPNPTAFTDDLGISPVAYDDHRKVTHYRMGDEAKPIATPRDWGVRRGHLRASMQLVMGELPDPSRRVPLDVKTVSEEQADGYRRRKITFAAEPGDRVPAWLMLPNGLSDRPQTHPAMLCLHQTTKIGKDEPAGLGGLPNLHYAHELVQRGFVCIVPDYPSFGEYPYDFKMQGKHYASGSMKAIWNNLRAVDVLESVPQVDPDRMGVIGHSLGGHNALFTAVFDLRLNAVVPSCGFTPFHDYYAGKLAGWTSDRYMPRIRDVYHNSPNEVPFDFPEILAALAPRAFFTNSPIGDGNFDVAGVRRGFADAQPIHDLLGNAAGRYRLETPDCGHDFPPEIRQEVYAWLEKVLK